MTNFYDHLAPAEKTILAALGKPKGFFKSCRWWLISPELWKNVWFILRGRLHIRRNNTSYKIHGIVLDAQTYGLSGRHCYANPGTYYLEGVVTLKVYTLDMNGELIVRNELWIREAGQLLIPELTDSRAALVELIKQDLHVHLLSPNKTIREHAERLIKQES